MHPPLGFGRRASGIKRAFTPRLDGRLALLPWAGKVLGGAGDDRKAWLPLLRWISPL
ncbi:Glycerol-3-phosphate dehydrogenase, mitochondrial, partial [Clarias magur]